MRTPPPPEMTCGFLIQLVFCKKKKEKWFIGVEVEQDTSAPPPKKHPGSAPAIPGFPHHASYVMIYFPNACQQDKFRLDTSSALLTHFTFNIPWFTWSEDYYSESPQSAPVNGLQHNSCQSINRNVSTHFCISCIDL